MLKPMFLTYLRALQSMLQQQHASSRALHYTTVYCLVNVLIQCLWTVLKSWYSLSLLESCRSGVNFYHGETNRQYGKLKFYLSLRHEQKSQSSTRLRLSNEMSNHREEVSAEPLIRTGQKEHDHSSQLPSCNRSAGLSQRHYLGHDIDLQY